MSLISIFIAVVAVALSQFNVPFALLVAAPLSGRLLIGPYLINKFFGVSAAAVSFPSIRGLRVHLLRRKANRRIELRFEGVRVRLTILHLFTESSRSKPPQSHEIGASEALLSIVTDPPLRIPDGPSDRKSETFCTVQP
jgi:hypothetical protein